MTSKSTNPENKESGKASLSEYKIGESCPSGHVIEYIYGKSDELMVYSTEKGAICWEYIGENEPSFSQATNLFETLASKIPYEIPQNVRESIKHQLAMSLFNSMASKNCEEAYSIVSKRIDDLFTPNQAKLRLILFSLIVSDQYRPGSPHFI